jgi:hypothetical protein
MSNMFGGFAHDIKSTTITLPNAFPKGFGSAATNMTYMFTAFAGEAKSLTTLTLPDFPAGFGSAATDVSYMFLDVAYGTIGINAPFTWHETTFIIPMLYGSEIYGIKWGTNGKILVPNETMKTLLINSGLSSDKVQLIVS